MHFERGQKTNKSINIQSKMRVSYPPSNIPPSSMTSLSPPPTPAVTTPLVPTDTSQPPPMSTTPPPPPKRNRGCCGALVGFLDLRLFGDPTYVNIMLGMSLAICAELNFSILLPFMLLELGYSTAQLASCLSTMAGADIVARFVAPFAGEWLSGAPEPRLWYMASLATLIVTRMGKL